MSPKIHTSFWSDQIVESLDAEGKLVLLWLITNPNTSLVGTFQPSLKRFQFDTSLPPEALQRAYQALSGSIAVVDGTVFIRNFIRHQFGVGPKLIKNNIFASIRSTYESIKDEELRLTILEEYPEFAEAEEGLTKGLQAQREREGTRTGKRKGEGELKLVLDPEELAEEIYQLYPLKVGKPDAIKKIMGALKNHDSVSLREKTQAYAKAVSGTDTIIPNPATWFNQERFNDDPSTWVRRNGHGTVKPDHRAEKAAREFPENLTVKML